MITKTEYPGETTDEGRIGHLMEALATSGGGMFLVYARHHKENAFKLIDG